MKKVSEILKDMNIETKFNSLRIYFHKKLSTEKLKKIAKCLKDNKFDEFIGIINFQEGGFFLEFKTNPKNLYKLRNFFYDNAGKLEVIKILRAYSIKPKKQKNLNSVFDIV